MDDAMMCNILAFNKISPNMYALISRLFLYMYMLYFESRNAYVWRKVTHKAVWLYILTFSPVFMPRKGIFGLSVSLKHLKPFQMTPDSVTLTVLFILCFKWPF